MTPAVAIAVGLVTVLLVAAVLAAVRARRPTDTTSPSSAAVYAAKMACKKAGDDQFPDSASARWQDLSQDLAVDLGNGQFHAQLAVDVQNGSGALLHEVVDCQITREGSFFHVTAVSITSR